MQNDTLRRATGLLARNRRRIAWKKIVSVLACIVVFCTTYALILPAITMEETVYCGMESHRHSEKCYAKVLICGQEEGEITAHTHTEDCVTTEQKLICNNEDPQHRHTNECYETIETYTCGMEEGKSTGHVHTDECYDSVLVCGEAEHIHELICYSNPNINVESPSVWLHSLSNVTLSGNNHNDLIEVAKSQLGYTESSLNYDVAEDGTTKKGYTRYGAWYGDPYGDWSAMFVSFCLYYANIPTEYCPQEADCSILAEKLQSDEYGFYVDAADGYEPLAGDLIFFDEDGDGSSDHVGMVAERVENNQGTLTKLKTIEGDVDNRVKYVTYPIKDEMILGYAAMPNIYSETDGDKLVQTFDGDDYSITVTYGANAEIPVSADLTAVEYDKDSEHYQQRYAEAAELCGWEADQSESIRLFNIGFYVGDKEIEPKAEVEVTITYANQAEAESYDIIHFAEEPEMLNADSFYVDGEQSIDFTLGHLSDIMAVAAEETDPDQTTPFTGITPNGTVINVFDYWITTRDAKDSTNAGIADNTNGGINNGHVLKFTGGSGHGLTNQWTGNGNEHNLSPKLPRYGLVEKTLGEDGYPLLTQYAVENTVDYYTGDPESLAYLFDPTVENAYKASFRNVGGLLQIDDQGYYYYDSQENFAELNEKTKQFLLYGPGVTHSSVNGQFFPFEDYDKVKDTWAASGDIHHYFGFTMTSRFVQRYDGHTNASRNTPTTFEFSGDDDVWVFIDGVLVGDIGGIHDAASLKIDFAIGEVVINEGTGVEKRATLKELFEAAGISVEGNEEWNKKTINNQEYWTFADNTYHTLKFYYMERGNYASNMKLKYNLTAVPATDIYKVDQYGKAISGVEFALYKSNEDWQLLNPDGTSPANGKDPEPAYIGTTDDAGAMRFVDDDGMPYTIKELREILGEHCVLKETKVPDGYRLVSEATHLRLTDKVLWCDNPYESGVWAMVTLNIAAPPTLILPALGNKEQNYYAFDNGASGIQGTLFGIVAQRMGNGSISALTSWAPVSGNSKDGYQVFPLQGEDDKEKEAYFKEKAIEIAKEKGTVFKMAPSGAMELEMNNLPGHIYDYLYMLSDADKEEKARFTTVYYWTEADSIDEATPENTFRVESGAPAPHAFDRTFGATIEVPNMYNRLFVQKYDPASLDENGYPTRYVNGAIFALFPANMNGKYQAKDAEGNDCWVDMSDIESGEYTLDVNFISNDDPSSSAKIIMSNGKEITAVEVLQTNSTTLPGTDGTCVFGIRTNPLKEGCYYLHEVQAPPGYEISTKPVMVRVTNAAIYANAGIKGDNIMVARGPGYLASTLHKAASAGDVNRTLTWIYQRLRVSTPSTSFDEAVPDRALNTVTWNYATDNGKQLASYLVYDTTPQELGTERFVANYVVDEENEQDNEPPRVAHDGTERTHVQQIVTDVGWSFNEIYQDYNYGYKWLTDMHGSAKYEDLRNPDGTDRNIYNLFSRSVYIKVGDNRLYSDLEISKQVVGADNTPVDSCDDEFTFTVNVEGLTGEYDYAIYNVAADGTRTPVEPAPTDKFTGNATITLKHNQVVVIERLPGGLKYTVTETPFSGYTTKYEIDDKEPPTSEEPVEGFVAEGVLICKKLKATLDNGERRYVSKVAFTNTRGGTIDLTVSKNAFGSETVHLSGAKFVLCTTLGDSTYYYTDTKWVKLDHDATPGSSLEHTTGADGTINLKGIPNGTYVLKEIAAPDGYLRLKEDINLTITNGAITEVTVGENPESEYVTKKQDNSLTVYNVGGHELPATGGTGITRYTTGGTLLSACAGILLLYIKRKRRMEDSVSS